jgi:hypothetical protein
MPNDDDFKTEDSGPVIHLEKCAHASCLCPIAPDRPFGHYCGRHCEEAGELAELKCECGHEECLGTSLT